MKFVLVPDSFKGTMRSTEICEIMSVAIRDSFPHADIVSIPMADGGEGTVDSFIAALGGKRVPLKTAGPYFDTIDSYYGMLSDGRTAVVEMSASAGLPLGGDNNDPSRATTYGVGQLMLDAARGGARKIIVGLGGSATNDGGCGMAAALGIRFFDANGNGFVPLGGTLADIARIDIADKEKALEGIEIITMCDVNNPMYGKDGAAHVFGPQKGADPAMTESLDAGLRHLAETIKNDMGIDVSNVRGGGAAGAMGAGMIAFAGSTLRMGIDTVLDTVGFDSLIGDASLIITGEGRIDDQSLRGKAIAGVAARAKKAGVPVVAIVGDIGAGIDAIYETGVTAIFSINRAAAGFDPAKSKSKTDLLLTVRDLMRFFSVVTEDRDGVT
ncbi:MAG: glycerate kinase [Clostridiales Family XIII bacterium]|nr:glycerate kinase [Clostridiales Family XIII bacterium]